MSRRNIGSNFDDFLRDEGLLEEVTAVAIKLYIAYRLAEKMSEQNLSKSELARRMNQSIGRGQAFGPGNGSVTLQTLQSAARTLGGRLKVELDFQDRAA